MNLKRPIIFFDLETTGIDPAKDRIVEISLIKVDPDGGKEIKTRRLNPEMPIPAEATAIHGISDADVAECPTFKNIVRSLAEFIDNSDLAGFNSNRFDVPLLVEEFFRAGIDIGVSKRNLVDVQNIFHKMEQRTLAAAYKFYCSAEIENAHSAEADVSATYEVLLAQLERYPELENDVKSLAEFSAMNRSVDLAGRIVLNDKDEAVFNFGKHKGKPVVQVFGEEPSYYNWIMNGDFPVHTKNVITEIRLKSLGK